MAITEVRVILTCPGRNYTLVKIMTDSGVHGVGDGTLNGSEAVVAEMLRHISELIERGEVQGIKDAMEQTLAPGSQTFEQDLFRLYSSNTITIDEALANADSPTNLSWLINNSEFGNGNGKDERKTDVALEFDSTSEGGASFKEFTLSLADHDEETH